MCRGRVVLISKIISANHAIVWGIIERNIFMYFISKFGQIEKNDTRQQILELFFLLKMTFWLSYFQSDFNSPLMYIKFCGWILLQKI